MQFNVAFRRLTILTFVAFAAACAKPPLEDIATAEAALQAARDAEAPTLAPEPYGEAESLMTDTYRFNDNKDYENARTKAQATTDKANEARDAALRAKAQGAADPRTETTEAEAGGDGGRIEVNDSAQTQAAIESEEIGAGSMDDGSRLRSLESVLFDFDSYSVERSQVGKVEAVAEWMDQNPSAKLKLEGHTDERGSADYNLSLGAKRAEAVKELLVTLGVQANRISTISYGEETPADPGHDEAAWRLNRRVEFVIQQ